MVLSARYGAYHACSQLLIPGSKYGTSCHSIGGVDSGAKALAALRGLGSRCDICIDAVYFIFRRR